MPEIIETAGNSFENCRRADAFKEKEPEKYQTLLKRLAELQDCRAKMAELRFWETETLYEIHQLAPPYEATYGGIGKVTVNKPKAKNGITKTSITS